MLILQQYGVTLKRVEHSDIEEIRYWRNKPFIRNTMQYRKLISKEMQEKWFLSINNKNNYYFVIQYNNKNIGVINIRDINLKEMYGEGGIFIWDKAFWNTYIPSFATFILLDFVFNILKISNKSFIRILKDNHNAINYNKSIGYVKIPYQNNRQHQIYVLTKEDYNKKTAKMKKAAQLITKDSGKMTVSGKISPLHIDEINNFLKQQHTNA